MIKSNQHFFNGLLILFDMIVVAGALFLAYYLRFSSPLFSDGIRVLRLTSYARLLLILLPIYLLLFVSFGLYKPYRKQRFYRECERIAVANLLGMIIILSILYAVRSVDFSRIMLGLFYLISTGGMIVERGIIRYSLRSMRKKGINIKHIIVVGAGKLGQTFIDKVNSDPHMGYQIFGYVDDYYPRGEKEGIPILGTTREMEKILEQNRVDEVIIALPNTSYRRINAVIDTCEFLGVKTQIIPDYFNLVRGSKPAFDELDGVPLINTRYVPLDDPFTHIAKRVFDIITSLLVLIILSPLLLVTAILVKVTSPGPIIYKQTRVGVNRKEFEIYKFRSMRNDVPEVGDKTWTTKDDPRKTKFGSFIRKTCIDELPQFVNVLKGDMSIVGPRPERPFFVNKYKNEVPQYMIKHHVRPGLTGLAQVRGYRGDTSIEKRIECDIEYIEKWSLWMEIGIIIKTPFSMFKYAY